MGTGMGARAAPWGAMQRSAAVAAHVQRAGTQSFPLVTAAPAPAAAAAAGVVAADAVAAGVAAAVCVVDAAGDCEAQQQLWNWPWLDPRKAMSVPWAGVQGGQKWAGGGCCGVGSAAAATSSAQDL